jgi:hypothetical protein
MPTPLPDVSPNATIAAWPSLEKPRGAVRSASPWQARQPVYATSVERWRRYEPRLGEFRELPSAPDRSVLREEPGR